MNKLRIDKYQKWIAISIISVIGVLFLYEIALAAITLVYFRAVSHDEEVVLEWETATELDNAGFFIRRSLYSNSGFSRISNFIPSMGDDLTGAFYQYIDEDVSNGITYWYILEAIDYSQNSELFTPAVSAIPGFQPTSTPTRTATQNLTPTQTGTVNTPTITPTRTPTKTRTSIPSATQTPDNQNPYPAPWTPTTSVSGTGNELSSTNSAEGIADSAIDKTKEISGTATLVPVPEISLTFPTVAKEIKYGSDQDVSLNSPTLKEGEEVNPVKLPIIFLAIILSFWSIILILFLVYTRRV